MQARKPCNFDNHFFFLYRYMVDLWACGCSLKDIVEQKQTIAEKAKVINVISFFTPAETLSVQCHAD